MKIVNSKLAILVLSIGFWSCNSPEEITAPTLPQINSSSSLKVFGPDGKTILSGNGTIPKKWQVLRFYTALNGDQSTVKEENVGWMNNSTQKDLLSSLPDYFKNATISFETSAIGLNGYGGISGGTFSVKLANGQDLKNDKGDFSFSSGLTPFYQTNFGVLIKNRKVIPLFYLDNKKLKIGTDEYKGEFLQVISPETNNLLSFPATVVLLFKSS